MFGEIKASERVVMMALIVHIRVQASGFNSCTALAKCRSLRVTQFKHTLFKIGFLKWLRRKSGPMFCI